MENLMIKAIRQFKKAKLGEIRNVYFLEWSDKGGLLEVEYVDKELVYHTWNVWVGVEND